MERIVSTVCVEVDGLDSVSTAVDVDVVVDFVVVCAVLVVVVVVVVDVVVDFFVIAVNSLVPTLVNNVSAVVFSHFVDVPKSIMLTFCSPVSVYKIQKCN